MQKVCKHCGHEFSPYRSKSNQEYCSAVECRRARKRLWQKIKMADDVDYRTNQKSARKAWQERNPDYMREYRKRSPGYVENNRLKQRERNKLRKISDENSPIAESSSLIVKVDDSKAHPITSAGLFRLVPVNRVDIVKMDEQIVHLIPLLNNSTQSFLTNL